MKRLLGFLLVLALMLTMPACAANDPAVSEATAATLVLAAAETSAFTDVPSGAWYAEAVAYLSGKGIITGTGNGKFSPDDTFNRAQLATVLYGSNAWAYTRLGKITGMSKSELQALLGVGNVTAVLSLADANM